MNGQFQLPGFIVNETPSPSAAAAMPAVMTPPPPPPSLPSPPAPEPPYVPGPADIVCFYIEPTGKAVERLRRYAWTEGESVCSVSKQGYHNAEVEIARDVVYLQERARHELFPHDDPRWPKACACGYVFVDDDRWQFNHLELYEDRPTGRMFTLWGDEAPVGAMWLMPSYGMTGPGGTPCLVVKTPDGHWTVDGTGDGSLKWERTGTPPLVTARPSILFRHRKLDGDGKPVFDENGKPVEEDGYHANLIDGVLRRS